MNRKMVKIAHLWFHSIIITTAVATVFGTTSVQAQAQENAAVSPKNTEMSQNGSGDLKAVINRINQERFVSIFGNFDYEGETYPQNEGSPKKYDVHPSTLKRGKQNDITIVSLKCLPKELTGATLLPPDISGISVLSIDNAKECKLNAKLLVSADTPLGRVLIPINQQQVRLGTVSLEVIDEFRFGYTPSRTSTIGIPKKRSWISRNWWVFPVLGGTTFGLIKAVPLFSGGDTIICADGTVSHAKNRQGACSHHGGIR